MFVKNVNNAKNDDYMKNKIFITTVFFFIQTRNKSREKCIRTIHKFIKKNVLLPGLVPAVSTVVQPVNCLSY